MLEVIAIGTFVTLLWTLAHVVRVRSLTRKWLACMKSTAYGSYDQALMYQGAVEATIRRSALVAPIVLLASVAFRFTAEDELAVYQELN